MNHYRVQPFFYVALLMLGACSPPDSKNEGSDMTGMDLGMDMSGDMLVEEDMPSDMGMLDMPKDLDVVDMVEERVCLEGSERVAIGEEICREGVLYVCNNQLSFTSRERTCADVPVDIQIIQISARATSEMTNIYRVKTLYTVTNLGTETALNLTCENQFDDEEGVSEWVDNIGFDTFMLAPGEEHVIESGYPKGEGANRAGTFRARCGASNEGELAASLRNEASTTYTY